MTAESQNSGSHEAATVTKTEGEERGGGPMREEEGGRDRGRERETEREREREVEEGERGGERVK